MSNNNMYIISEEEINELRARPTNEQITELKQIKHEKILRRNRVERMIYKVVPICGAIIVGIIIATIVEILI